MVLSHWVFSGWHSQLLSGTNCCSYSNICKELQIARNCFNPLCNLFNGRSRERERRAWEEGHVSPTCVSVLSCTHYFLAPATQATQWVETV